MSPLAVSPHAFACWIWNTLPRLSTSHFISTPSLHHRVSSLGPGWNQSEHTAHSCIALLTTSAASPRSLCFSYWCLYLLNSALSLFIFYFPQCPSSSNLLMISWVSLGKTFTLYRSRFPYLVNGHNCIGLAQLEFNLPSN